MNIFGKYADFYDHLYSDKDYQSECKLIVNLFKKYQTSPINTVLDLGCGTGNHAFILNKMGFEITGIDRSKAMLQIAKSKLKRLSQKTKISFKQADLRNFGLNRQSDAAIMMFGVLSYQISNNDVLNTLISACKHLKKGGLFIFDVWFGPAVLHERPSQKIKIAPTPNGQILRFTSSTLDILKHKCAVHFSTWQIAKKKLVSYVEETHYMRYFFPKELELFLQQSGFKLVKLGAFPRWRKDPTENTWNILGIARVI